MNKGTLISDAGASILTVAYALLMTFGVLSNGLIIATYFKWRQTMLSRSKDIFLLSLAIGDFTMSLLVVPQGVSSATSKQWTTGNAGCIWYGFISTWIGLSSMLQLATIAVECYITLSQPTPHPVTTKRTVQAIAASWISAFVTSCFPLMGWSKYTFEGYGLHCSVLWNSSSLKDGSYCLFLLVFFFVIPVAAIVFSYGKIFLTVKYLYMNARKIWGEKALAVRWSYEAQVKTSKQILLVITGFLFAWTPYAIVSTLKLFDSQGLPFGYHEIPSLLAKTSVIYNPIIYFFNYQGLRNKAFEILKGVQRLCPCKEYSVQTVHTENA